MLDKEHLEIFWKVLEQYIPAKEKSIAAEHLVSELIDAGVEEDDLFLIASDSTKLIKVVKSMISSEDEDEDNGYDE